MGNYDGKRIGFRIPLFEFIIICCASKYNTIAKFMKCVSVGLIQTKKYHRFGLNRNAGSDYRILPDRFDKPLFRKGQLFSGMIGYDHLALDRGVLQSVIADFVVVRFMPDDDFVYQGNGIASFYDIFDIVPNTERGMR